MGIHILVRQRFYIEMPHDVASPLQDVSRSVSQTALGDLFIPSTPAKEAHDLLVFEEGQTEGATGWSLVKDRPLETCHDILCDSSTFQVRKTHWPLNLVVIFKTNFLVKMFQFWF